MTNTYDITKIRVDEDSAKWMRNNQLGVGNEECFFCGRCCNGTFRVLMNGCDPEELVRVDLFDQEKDGECEDRQLSCGSWFRFQGFWPIGSVCAKKVPKEFVKKRREQ